ncbi:MAG: AAA family ATPase [Gemmatimonadales bacterium]|nr:MAG: AAA family ATPase [Gemmatimonadales bacterium]
MDDAELLDRAGAAMERIRQEVARRVVGQEQVVEGLLLALLADGHALVVGVPGLAKTLLVQTLADSLGLEFARVQFTPDLMPTDITGTEIMEEDRATGTRAFRFIPGPVFTNVLLADEINRTPPKTQAALLQAMQERAVTAGGSTRPLPRPFFVLATRNPIEQEGTYPLPEAQLDRFMFEIRIGYPSREEEEAVARRTTGEGLPEVEPVVEAADLLAFQGLVRRVPVAPSVISLAVQLARSTRPHDEAAAEVARRHLAWGAGPRASQALVLGARARAVVQGRAVPTAADVRAVAPLVLGHRIVLGFEAEAEGMDREAIVDELLAESLRLEDA